MGLDFPNRVGLAAGLDKDAVAVRGFADLGFGFIEVGTVTPRPQRGNPKPRLFRSVPNRALINRMGFNSDGMDAVRQRLVRLRKRPLRTLVGINIGKNRDTPLADALDDYRAVLAAVHDLADYVTVNISSPNTPGLRDLQASHAADRLLTGCLEPSERDTLGEASGRRVPLAVKIAPDLDASLLCDIAAVVKEIGHRCGGCGQHHPVASGGSGTDVCEGARRTQRSTPGRRWRWNPSPCCAKRSEGRYR